MTALGKFLGLDNDEGTEKVKQPDMSVSYRSKYLLQREKTNKLAALVEDMRTLGMDFKEKTSNDFTAELGKWVDLPQHHVRYKRVDNGKDFAKFEYEMGPGGELGPQIFNKEELYIRVISGNILNRVNRLTYRQGDVVHIKKGKKHYFCSTEKASIILLFAYSEECERELFK